jgi:hypothetical protein
MGQRLNRSAGLFAGCCLALFGILFGAAGVFLHSEPRSVASAEWALRQEPTPEKYVRLAEEQRAFVLEEVLLRGTLLGLSGLFAYGAFRTFRATRLAPGPVASDFD